MSKNSQVVLDSVALPGATLSDIMMETGVSVIELSYRLGISSREINDILVGKKHITPMLACRLANIFEPNASFWNNLQREYDEACEEMLNYEGILESEMMLLETLPVYELMKDKYVDFLSDDVKENVLFFRKYLGYANLLNIKNTLSQSVIYRRLLPYDPIILASWIKICQIETAKIKISQEINYQKIRALLPLLKQWNNLTFDEILAKAQNYLQEAGVAFALVPRFQGASARGFFKNIRGNISMCVSLSIHSPGLFVHTLAVEIGILLTNRIDTTFIDLVPADVD